MATLLSIYKQYSISINPRANFSSLFHFLAKAPSLVVALMMMICAAVPVWAYAAESTPGARSPQRTMLVIDSYNENAPWAKAVLTPLSYFIAQRDSVHAEIVYLNSVLVTDSMTYNKVRGNLISEYKDRHIDYVVFIGNLAFSMRDDVKRFWGDIPMLLITRDMTLAPLEYYFSGYDKPLISPEMPTLEVLRPEYNFTVVHVPDLYRETIDLMVDMIDDMDELVLFTDATYFNRNLAANVENYLFAEYPEIRYQWVQASAGNPELRYFLINRSHNSGLLLSNWFYSDTNALGYPILEQGDINLLFSAMNPFFTLKRSYMDMGAVGGVFNDNVLVAKAIVDDVEAMLMGDAMRDIKFTSFQHSRVPVINYPLLKEYDLSDARCPAGTVFIDKPLSFWQRYFWPIVVTAVLALVFLFLMLRNRRRQRQKIELLSRHKQFVDNMPIPYTKAKVVYNEDMSAILDVRYTMSNQAFDDIIRENSNPKQQYLLFSPEFISDKTAEMIEAHAPISFLYRFEKSDKYYIFTLCLVDTQRKRANRDIVDMIDIFAVDITDRQKAQDELKLITRRLDLTIDVADLIPWEWDMTTDNMVFDAYSLFQRQRTVPFDSSYTNSAHSVVTVGEYMKLIHPDDREVMRAIREDLFLDKVKKFTVEYRMVLARQNQQTIEWVEVKGAIARRDEEGRPAIVMGSMTVITDRKNQERAVIEAERRSADAEALKEKFMASISHHVRIQLNAIVGFASIMSETDDPEKRREFAGIIQDNNDELLKYIDDMAGENSSLKPISDDDDDSASSAKSVPTADAKDDGSLVRSHYEPTDEADRHIARPSTTTPLTMRQKPAAEPAKGQPGAQGAPAPQRQPAAQPQSEAPAQKTETTAQAAKPQGAGAKRPLVLVAEDIEGNYLLLKHFIPKQYEIVHAWTGAEALDMFQERRPDIVLMDIGMPVMDGYKATAEIRKLDTDVPIVAVTAYTFASERDLIMSSGFDDYMSKPVSKDMILDALKRYVPLN